MSQEFRIVESNQAFIPASKPQVWETMPIADARGYAWLYEKPIFNATYVIGCDPAYGITGWDRSIAGDDQDNDNSAIEVFRIGKREVEETDKETGKKIIRTVPTDYQVAEYAAPVDYEACAAVVNALGRLYRGNGKMGCAHTIVEVFPGNGWMVEKTLIQKYGYLNFYHRKFIDTLQPQESKGIGWQASYQSVRDLWIHGTRILNTRNVVLRSPWLISEMETTTPIKFFEYRSEAQSGFHDDRLRAMMLCLWAAHDFSYGIKSETATTIEKNSKAVNWQASDLSVDKLEDEWTKRFHEIGNS